MSINNNHCAEATLKTSIIILAIDNHNKNPAMLAIKDLNNIIRFGKPVPVILNHTAGLGYPCSKGDNPIFRSKNFQMFDDYHMLATYHRKSSRFNQYE